MSFRTTLLWVLIGGSAFAAPVPKELRKSDAERMRGVWVQEDGMRWFFDEQTLYLGGIDTSGNKGIAYALVTRPGAAGGELDFGGGKAFQYYAIYQFHGDDMRLAYGGGRPTDFTPQPGENKHVLKRIPKEKK